MKFTLSKKFIFHFTTGLKETYVGEFYIRNK